MPLIVEYTVFRYSISSSIAASMVISSLTFAKARTLSWGSSHRALSRRPRYNYNSDNIHCLNLLRPLAQDGRSMLGIHQATKAENHLIDCAGSDHPCSNITWSIPLPNLDFYAGDNVMTGDREWH